MASPTRNVPTDIEPLYRLQPWNDTTERLIHEGRVTLSSCPGLPTEAKEAERARVFCGDQALEPSSRIPPGTKGFRLDVTDTQGALDGGVWSQLVTQRGIRLVGIVREQAPYSWNFTLDHEERPGAWTLPDHADPGYRIRVATTVPPPPGRDTVAVKLYALADPAWRPIEVFDAYRENDTSVVAPGVRLFTEAKVELKTTAGSQMTPVAVPNLSDAYVPMGTKAFVVLVRWADSADCPAWAECVPIVYIRNGQNMAELRIGMAEARGANWMVFQAPTNFDLAPVWSELAPTAAPSTYHSVMVDTVSCIMFRGECLRVNEQTYMASYGQEALVTVETWNHAFDLEEIEARYEPER